MLAVARLLSAGVGPGFQISMSTDERSRAGPSPPKLPLRFEVDAVRGTRTAPWHGHRGVQ